MKTTTGATSTHHVQGFHQVEFGHGVGGVAETHLFLFSLGVRWLQPEPGVGETIPELVETILARLPQPDGAWFLECLKRYGNDEATGYDHSAQNGSSAFARPFTLTFKRLYDLRDPQVRIIRRSDVEDAVFTPASSVRFKVEFPARISGDVNPVVGLRAIVEAILGAAR